MKIISKSCNKTKKRTTGTKTVIKIKKCCFYLSLQRLSHKSYEKRFKKW